MKVTGKLPRRRKPKAPLPQPVSRVARMLALAHHVERLVEGGQLSGYAEAARLLGVSRSRLGQVVGLLGLSAEMQSGILTGEFEVGERALRAMARETEWGRQWRKAGSRALPSRPINDHGFRFCSCAELDPHEDAGDNSDYSRRT